MTIDLLRLTSTAADGIPAFAVRVGAAVGSLVCSADIAAGPSLTQLAEGCDVLLRDDASVTARMG